VAKATGFSSLYRRPKGPAPPGHQKHSSAKKDKNLGSETEYMTQMERMPGFAQKTKTLPLITLIYTDQKKLKHLWSYDAPTESIPYAKPQLASAADSG
jgi:hypothetical protein